MKNFASFVTKSSLENIVKAHDGGIVGSFIPTNLLEEISEIKSNMTNNEEIFVINLKCSDELKNFIDEFFTDVKECIANGQGSLFAENFISLK